MDRRIDLDRARREAKALLCAARAGDAESLARMRAEREPRLADAQRAVANDLGEPSWPGLARRVEAEARADVDELLHAVFAASTALRVLAPTPATVPFYERWGSASCATCPTASSTCCRRTA